MFKFQQAYLAQVDSSVGGKTGINIGNFKKYNRNFLSTQINIYKLEALKTLPDEEFMGGMGEVIKYSLIYDYEFLDYLNRK